jgi:hypothetical protein
MKGLLESALLGLTMVMASTVQQPTAQQPTVLAATDATGFTAAFDPNTTLGKAQLLIEIKERYIPSN